MAFTAARLGSSPITIDWSNFANVPAGTGTAALKFAPDAQTLSDAWMQLRGRFESSEVGFYHAPIDNTISQANESQTLAEHLLQQGIFTDCLFLGIGGSALGPISLLSALQDLCHTKVQFHFMENPDPLEWKATVKKLHPTTTLVCVVTKSGTTFETIAQFTLALEWLEKERWKSHVVAITDPARGDLKAFAEQEGISTLHIVPSIGGRFSVFSPVGLFPAALSGLSVKNFLHGAQQVRDYIEKAPIEKNPLFILGHDLIRHFNKRPIHVCMPYSTRLKLIGNWFVQLWCESLGKDQKGFTALPAIGATDQHSILQLLRDGPDDKVTWFITIDHTEDKLEIPALTATKRFEAFRSLEKHSLQELLLTEYRATSLVLTKQNRPNLTFQLDQLDERSLGALYFAFSFLTSITGTLWGVNPFDQPGVEEGKVYIRQFLSKQESLNSVEEIDENSPVARLRRDK